MHWKKSLLLITIVVTVPCAAYARWERQFICFDPSSFVGISAYDETHVSANGQIKTTGDNPVPVVFFTKDGKSWSQGAFTQPAGSFFSAPLLLDAPAADVSYLVLATITTKLKNQADFEQSTDRGSSFQMSKTSPAGSIGASPRAMHYIDKMNGWVLGTAGTSSATTNWIARTQDGGKTWDEKGVIGYEQDISYPKIFFINDKFGWMVGGDEGAFDSSTGDQTRDAGRGVIQYTTDGGKTWTKAVSEAPYLFESVTFSDCLNGWASATDNYMKARLFRTVNGGRTQEDWQEIALPKYPDQNKRDYTSISALRFFDAGEGWALAYIMSGTGSSKSFLTNVLYTKDGGKNWISDTVYPDAAKAVTDAPCCFQEIDPSICTGGMIPLAAAGAGGFSMTWPTRNTGWVAGSNAIIMKYTADTPSTGSVHRCVACCGGKCPNDTDGGFSTSCGESDGGSQVDSGVVQDASVDVGEDSDVEDSGQGLDAGRDGGKKDGGGGGTAGGCSCGTVNDCGSMDGTTATSAGFLLFMLAFLYRRGIICRRKEDRQGL